MSFLHKILALIKFVAYLNHPIRSLWDQVDYITITSQNEKHSIKKTAFLWDTVHSAEILRPTLSLQLLDSICASYNKIQLTTIPVKGWIKRLYESGVVCLNHSKRSETRPSFQSYNSENSLFEKKTSLKRFPVQNEQELQKPQPAFFWKTTGWPWVSVELWAWINEWINHDKSTSATVGMLEEG